MYFFFFFFNDTATTEIYTLSLHDALPIYVESDDPVAVDDVAATITGTLRNMAAKYRLDLPKLIVEPGRSLIGRSEEHTSELQSQSNLVCRLLLEKKKKIMQVSSTTYT